MYHNQKEAFFAGCRLLREAFMELEMTQQLPFRIAHTDPMASVRLADRLNRYLRSLPADKRIAIVCLGTDRSTGDSLGPLAGSALSKFHSRSFDVFGTLEEPVHALNLDDTLARLYAWIPNPFVIGIDACLGKPSSIGCIQIGEGPIHPGAGVNKELTPVGDIHISVIVNLAGYMEYVVLQNTRLYLVKRMADLIARSLFIAVSELHRNEQSP
jgi:putative sporulation protein YyaC